MSICFLFVTKDVLPLRIIFCVAIIPFEEFEPGDLLSMTENDCMYTCPYYYSMLIICTWSSLVNEYSCWLFSTGTQLGAWDRFPLLPKDNGAYAAETIDNRKWWMHHNSQVTCALQRHSEAPNWNEPRRWDRDGQARAILVIVSPTVFSAQRCWRRWCIMQWGRRPFAAMVHAMCPPLPGGVRLAWCGKWHIAPLLHLCPVVPPMYSMTRWTFIHDHDGRKVMSRMTQPSLFLPTWE
jgi:hypothetical protein